MSANQIGFVCLAASASMALILTPLAIRLATALGLVDLPGARKIHLAPVPRIGGIAMRYSPPKPGGRSPEWTGQRVTGIATEDFICGLTA